MKSRFLVVTLALGLALVLVLLVLTSQAAPTTRPSTNWQEQGVVLSPPAQAGSGEPGSAVTYTLQLTNQTGMVDSFDIAIQPGSAWITTVSLGQTGALTPGGNLSFTVGVGIPALASPEDQDRVTIVATSVASPTVYSATATLTTTAIRGLLSVYLPAVRRHWPPVPDAPVLYPIEMGAQGSYSVRWSSVALADSYLMEEATTPDLGDGQIAYQGADTSYFVASPPPGSSFYRVQALNDGWASGWSEMRFIFQDSFGNPASGWEVVDDDYVRTEYLGGEYRILSKQSGYFYLLRAPTYEIQNYAVEVDAHWEGASGNSYGLVFGITPGFGQYYLFEVNTDYHLYRLLRRDPSGFAVVAPASDAPPLNGGAGTNRLKVVRQDGQITLVVNGIVMGTWNDGAIGGLTGAGIVSSPYSESPRSDARFDNFAVVSRDGSQAMMVQGSSGGIRAGAAERDRQPGDLGW